MTRVTIVGGGLAGSEATWQLARRQMKWFRRFKYVTWLQGDRSTDQLVTDVAHRLSLGV